MGTYVSRLQTHYKTSVVPALTANVETIAVRR